MRNLKNCVVPRRSVLLLLWLVCRGHALLLFTKFEVVVNPSRNSDAVTSDLLRQVLKCRTDEACFGVKIGANTDIPKGMTEISFAELSNGSAVDPTTDSILFRKSDWLQNMHTLFPCPELWFGPFYTTFSYSCYVFLTPVTFTWFSSHEAYCDMVGGRVTSVETPPELAYIAEVAPLVSPEVVIASLNLIADATGTGWIWGSDGNALTLQDAWMSGEPGVMDGSRSCAWWDLSAGFFAVDCDGSIPATPLCEQETLFTFF